MYGYIYLTTNLVNGKGYIGKHKSSEYDPSYIGSGGRRFQCALQKHGRENFLNEFLIPCFSQEELDDEEEFLIDYFNCVESEDYYNRSPGGRGGNSPGEHSSNYNRKFSKEWRANLSKAHKGKRLSESAKCKISTSLIGNNYGTSNKGRRFSESHKSKISSALVGNSNGSGKRSEEFSRKMSAVAKGNKATAGTIWINNGTKNKRINPSEFNEFKKLGWKRGRK